VEWEKVACWSTKAAISLKRVKIDEKLLWRAYRKSPTPFRTYHPRPLRPTVLPRLVRNPHPKLQSLLSQEWIMVFGLRRTKLLSQFSVQLLSKISNLCDPDPPTSQTDDMQSQDRALHFSASPVKIWKPKIRNENEIEKTRMRGKAQPDGRPSVELIETPVLLFASCGHLLYTCNAAFRLTRSCCNKNICAIKLRNHEIEIYVCPLHSRKLKSTLSHGLNIVWKCCADMSI